MTGLQRVWLVTCARRGGNWWNWCRGGEWAQLSNIILRGYNSVPDEEQSVLPNLQSIILQGQGEDYIQGRLLTTALIPFHLVLGWKTWSLLQRMKAKSRWSLSRPNFKEFYLHGLPRFKSFTTGRYLIVIKIPGKYVPCFSEKNTPFGWHFFTSVVSSFPTSCSGIPSLLAVFSAHSCLPLWIGLVILVLF